MTCSAALRIAIGFLLSIGGMAAQPAKLEFEVATVRPTDPARRLSQRVSQGGPGTGDPGRIVFDGVTLEILLRRAFNLKRHQIEDGERFTKQRFDITAKLPAGTTQETLRVMLQNLLAERWHLKSHPETRERSVYVLLQAKGGSKLTPAATTPAAEGSLKMGEDGCPQSSAGRLPTSLYVSMGGYCVTGTGQTMAGLVDTLSGQFDRMVLDRTELTGAYDFSMRFYPPHGSPPEGDDRTPDVFTAMQRLGLRMESRKAPVEVLVVDSVDEKPTEN